MRHAGDKPGPCWYSEPVTPPTQKPHEKHAELVRRLTQLAPAKRIDALLDEIDGRALVRSVPAEDVYRTIVEVGLSDAVEVVQLATPEQFRTFVDLAAWQRDRVDPIEVLHWLRAARGDDDDDFIKKLQHLDLELLELLFRRLTVIHDLEEDPDVDPAGPAVETPEGKYLVELRLDGPDEAALRRLLYDLTTHNPFELGRFLEAARWELPTELEETAYQFRQARLQDLGFPPLDEAVKVFAWRDPDKVLPVARSSSAALAPPAGESGPDFVGAAFEGLEPVERQNLEAEVRFLVNCVLLAEGAEPGDPPAIRRYSERARDLINLGLEHVTGCDVRLAAQAVRERPLKEIFQTGFSLTLRLRRQAERLVSEAGTRFGETLLALDEEAAAVGALLRRRPLKALRTPGAEPVPFRSRRELVESAALLERVRLQRDVFAGLLGASPAEAIGRFGASLSELGPQRLFASVVARAEVDGVLDVGPLPALRLQELCARLFDEGSTPRLRSSAGERAAQVLSERLACEPTELGVMVQRVLGAMRDDFGAQWCRSMRVPAQRITSLAIGGELVV